jgi:hypothetical protein
LTERATKTQDRQFVYEYACESFSSFSHVIGLRRKVHVRVERTAASDISTIGWKIPSEAPLSFCIGRHRTCLAAYLCIFRNEWNPSKEKEASKRKKKSEA